MSYPRSKNRSIHHALVFVTYSQDSHIQLNHPRKEIITLASFNVYDYNRTTGTKSIQPIYHGPPQNHRPRQTSGPCLHPVVPGDLVALLASLLIAVVNGAHAEVVDVAIELHCNQEFGSFLRICTS